MRTLANIALSIITLASLYVICATPFGEYTGVQYAVNAITVFLVLPALAFGFFKANPELMENNSLFKA